MARQETDYEATFDNAPLGDAGRPLDGACAASAGAGADGGGAERLRAPGGATGKEAGRGGREAEAKRKAEAAKKDAAAAEAKRKAAQKQAEEKRRAAEQAAKEAASALAGEFVDIPGGTFQMGCSPGDGECQDDERPVHTVSIKPFRMGRHEVTVGQFRRFVEATSYRTDAERGGNCLAVQADRTVAEQSGRDWRNPGFPQTEREPLVCVSWNDAEAYVQWLSRQGVGRYRLPSEREWEYAARAGGSARYSFGDSEAMLCVYGNVADRTAKRQFSPSFVGLFEAGHPAMTGRSTPRRSADTGPIGSGYTTCMGMSGNGQETAITTATPARRPTGRRGPLATVPGAWTGAVPGATHRGTVPPPATGFRPSGRGAFLGFRLVPDR